MTDNEPDLVEYVAVASAVIRRNGGPITLSEGARLRVARNDLTIAPQVLARLVNEGRLRPVAAWRRGARVAGWDF